MQCSAALHFSHRGFSPKCICIAGFEVTPCPLLQFLMFAPLNVLLKRCTSHFLGALFHSCNGETHGTISLYDHGCHPPHFFNSLLHCLHRNKRSVFVFNHQNQKPRSFDSFFFLTLALCSPVVGKSKAFHLEGHHPCRYLIGAWHSTEELCVRA